MAFVQSRLAPLPRVFLTFHDESSTDQGTLRRSRSFADFTPYDLGDTNSTLESNTFGENVKDVNEAAETVLADGPESASADVIWPDTDAEDEDAENCKAGQLLDGLRLAAVGGPQQVPRQLVILNSLLQGPANMNTDLKPLASPPSLTPDPVKVRKAQDAGLKALRKARAMMPAVDMKPTLPQARGRRA
ncbi:unnamed protein product [Symbiodinium natans]|uniref:Uncharacterized protein n=1 Tax=Symbiodinium natans TaxID=878477 RepID=A0A812NWQ3_9DINO|nr:unnamed protein product [Symbiodinium natans]